MAQTVRVEVVGLKNLRAQLKAAPKAARKAITTLNKSVSEGVAAAGRATMASSGWPKASAGAAGIKGYATIKGATVEAVAGNPFTLAREFGAAMHPVFGVMRPQASFVRRVAPPPSGEGYAVGPAGRAAAPMLEAKYADAFHAAAAKALGAI